ncbi:MAG: hypothetical protein JWM19_4436 [Actinomycetia bacterium]|nr:hypothetical protein [Actinomycetes bacterium]
MNDGVRLLRFSMSAYSTETWAPSEPAGGMVSIASRPFASEPVTKLQ